MKSSMESYEVSYFQVGEQGNTWRQIYYCNMHKSDDQSQLNATEIQIKWNQ